MHTPNWGLWLKLSIALLTPSFPFKKGIFQGDTLSPLLLLLAFNPVIEPANQLQTTGYRSCRCSIIPGMGCSKTWWPYGLVFAIVFQNYVHGQSQVMYSNGDTKTLNLKSVHWVQMRKGWKAFLFHSKAPPRYPLKKVRDETTHVKFFNSESHTDKAYADDLTVLSRKLHDHQVALSQINACCVDVDLELCPDKRVTFSYNGKEFVKNAKVQLAKLHQVSWLSAG